MLHQLNIDVSQFGAAASNAEHIRSALKRGLPELVPAMCAHDGTFVIVGSGPSLPDHIEELREERKKRRPICAINGALGFIHEKGVTPEFFLTVDPRPMPQNLKMRPEDTIYLLASRVNPETFDAVKDRKVVMWHSWSVQEECDELKGRLTIGGGTTSGLRAVNVGYVLGFRKFILYGMDSCLADDKSTKRFTGEKAGAIIDVIVNGRRFWCNHAMAQQAQDFQLLYNVMPDITIEAKGDGLIAAIIADRKRRGVRT